MQALPMKNPKKPRNNGQWTEARFRQFITSVLRNGSRKWSPIHTTKKDARVARGKYKCNGCKKTVGVSRLVKGKRVNNVFVDHIKPVIDPDTGFTSWDDVIERLYCETDNLQLLCAKCHDKKTAEERKRRNAGTKV